MIGELIARLDTLLSAVQRGRAVNVNDQETKDRAIELATLYFKTIRPPLVRGLGETQEILEHDQEWQDLVRLAHGNNARRTYLNSLRALKKRLGQLNVSVLSTVSLSDTKHALGARSLTAEESLLIETLERLVPSASASYRQGLLDLRSADRLSYRGTATEFREALREVLDHLAPDADVVAQPGFKLETGQTKPTMKQKVRFVLISRGLNKSQRESSEKSLGLIEELSGEVARAVYNRASVATHVHESRREVQKIKRYVDTVLFDLLEISL
jgi:hypothetical protein